MLVAHSVVWGFATPHPSPGSMARFELVHVPGLGRQVQYCRIGLAEQEVLVLFLAGGALTDPDVAAVAAWRPNAALAVVFDDAIDRARALAIRTSPGSAAAAVAIAKYNGTLTDATRWEIEVDSIAHVADIEFKNHQWAATVRPM